MKRLKRSCEEFVGITKRRVDIREVWGFKLAGSRKRGGNESAFFGFRFMGCEGGRTGGLMDCQGTEEGDNHDGEVGTPVTSVTMLKLNGLSSNKMVTDW